MVQTLHPIDMVESAECEAEASAKRVQCAVCSTVVNDAAVVTHEADHDVVRDCDAVLRLMYCPHCENIQTWREEADHEGNPTGQVLDRKPARIFSAKVVDRFLRKYPQMKGVQQT